MLHELPRLGITVQQPQVDLMTMNDCYLLESRVSVIGILLYRCMLPNVWEPSPSARYLSHACGIYLARPRGALGHCIALLLTIEHCFR